MGHSFGTSTTEHSVNRKLVDLMHDYANGRPIIGDRMLVSADPAGEQRYAHIIDGPITNARDHRSGTGMALVNAKAYMDQAGLSTPLMIAQKYHIDRVVLQAARLGLSSIVPKGLPGTFDRDSKQFWTKGWLLFIPLNAYAHIKLKLNYDL